MSTQHPLTTQLTPACRRLLRQSLAAVCPLQAELWGTIRRRVLNQVFEALLAHHREVLHRHLLDEPPTQEFLGHQPALRNTGIGTCV